MKECEWRESGTQCAQWAQWRAAYPGPDKIVRKLCNAHKIELEKENKGRKEEEKIKFVFCGAMPQWL